MEHIVCLLLAQMVDEQDGDAVLVRQPFQHRQVPIVVGVGGVVDRTDHLQRVDDDQHRIWMGGEEYFHLLLQPLTNGRALRTEVDAAWRVLGDLKEPVLDAKDGVLQAEVERSAPLHAHPPDEFTLGHGHRQPQGQPGLAHLGRARQDMQPLSDQRVHHEVGRTQRLAHQKSPINRVEFHVINASYLLWSVGFVPRFC